MILLYSKSYSAKKGENQATKEDIGKITEIVEGIKKDLADNTEKLKSELVLQNEHIISLRILERDSLINYYKDLHSLISYLIRVDISIYSLENYRDADRVDVQISAEFYKYTLAEANVELFWDEELFIKRKKDLNILMIKLRGKTGQILRKIKHEFEIANIKLNNENNPEIEIHKDLNNNINTSSSAFIKEKSEIYKDIRAIDVELRQMIRSRLKEILKTS